jgi:hypothetical protein
MLGTAAIRTVSLRQTAMPLDLPCPSCGQALRVPEDLLGRDVRCPGCATTFTPRAPADANAPSAAASITAGEPAGGEPPRRAAEEHEERPRRRDEDDEDTPAPPRYGDDVTVGRPNHAVLVLVLGIVGVVLAVVGICVLQYILDPVAFGLSLAAWIVGHLDLAAIRAGKMDPRGQEMARAGWICGIVGTILPVVSGACWCAFVVIYLGFFVGLAGAGAGAGHR